MSATGSWKLSITTPLGEQTPVLTVKQEADTLTGELALPGAAPAAVKDGVARGQDLTWTSDIKVPIQVTVHFSVTVRGDTLSGECSSSMFTGYKVTGRRG